MEDRVLLEAEAKGGAWEKEPKQATIHVGKEVGPRDHACPITQGVICGSRGRMQPAGGQSELRGTAGVQCEVQLYRSYYDRSTGKLYLVRTKMEM